MIGKISLKIFNDVYIAVHGGRLLNNIITTTSQKNKNKIIDIYFFTIIGVAFFACGLLIAMQGNDIEEGPGKIGTTIMIAGVFLATFDLKKDVKGMD